MRTKKDKINSIMSGRVLDDCCRDSKADSAVLKLKDAIKNNMFLYHLSNMILFPIKFNFYYSRRILKYLSKDAIILNLGSGNKNIDDSFINIDQRKYKNVDIIADINRMPIKDDCVDGVVSEVTLEHLSHPETAMKEMVRVLKPGGYLCLSVPFLFHFHESPDDFHRWTKSGIINLLKENDFEVVKFINLGGPVGSFNLITSQVLAIILSFNIKVVYHILSYLFLFILSPLLILDPAVSRFSMASNAASVFLVIAKKTHNI